MDGIVSIEPQRMFYHTLLAHYGEQHRDLITFQEIPRLNHHISLGMIDDMLAWLDASPQG